MFIIPWQDLTDWVDIGSGAFGKIFKADYLGTEVAIKEFIDVSQQPSFDLKKYTDREISLLQECRHPNVVQFMGCTENERKIYAVTEYVNGGNLKQMLLTSPLRWRIRVSFAEDAARALAYLHSRDIIHRDLKSENLLITENKRIKVCDFGLSREKPRTMDEKRRMSFCGTDAYMAPEIILGMSFDTAVDIFSFGIILLELILGIVGDCPEHYPEGLSRTRVMESKGPRMDSDRIHPLFWRVIPGFGVDIEKIKALCPMECPPEFLNLAIECVAEEPKDRPDLKTIIKRLRDIEKQVLKTESNEFGLRPLNIGVLSASDLALCASAQELPVSDSQDSIQRSKEGVQTPSVAIIPEDGEASFEALSLERQPSRSRCFSVQDPMIQKSEKLSADALSRSKLSSSLNDLAQLAAHPTSDSKSKLALVMSPTSPTHRLTHLIPHRFSLVYLPTRSKCKVCFLGFKLTSRHLVCDDCGYHVHKKCAKDAPATCGLTAESLLRLNHLIVSQGQLDSSTGTTPSSPAPGYSTPKSAKKSIDTPMSPSN